MTLLYNKSSVIFVFFPFPFVYVVLIVVMDPVQEFKSTIRNAVIFGNRLRGSRCRDGSIINILNAHLHKLATSVILHIPEELLITAVAAFKQSTDVDVLEEGRTMVFCVSALGDVVTARTFNLLQTPSVSPRFILLVTQLKFESVWENPPATVRVLNSIATGPV
jgi:hypothetical protein